MGVYDGEVYEVVGVVNVWDGGVVGVVWGGEVVGDVVVYSVIW